MRGNIQTWDLRHGQKLQMKILELQREKNVLYQKYDVLWKFEN